jgi:hypothetical protein
MSKEKAMQVKCPCGVISKKINRSGSVGDTTKEAGFFALLTYIGDIIYLCPKCYKEAHGLAMKLLAIAKNKNLYFPNLIK